MLTLGDVGNSDPVLLRIHSECLTRVDLSRLQSSDDFSTNLSFLWDFDSLANVEIVSSLENRFGIKISDEEAVAAHTVADLVALVSGKVATGAAT